MAFRDHQSIMERADVCIAGAGIIGLTLALALEQRGARVIVATAGEMLSEASSAAAGMLAVDDPENPVALLPLSRISRELYPVLLDRLASITGARRLHFQTSRTLQAVSTTNFRLHPLSATELNAVLPGLAPGGHHFAELAEASLDPRELAPLLIAAARAAPSITVHTGSGVVSMQERQDGVLVGTAQHTIHAGQFVDCTGAWSLSNALHPSLRVTPRKGQMLTVATPRSLAHGLVLRTESVYLVPRLHGPRAGQTVVGATVEEVGFDRRVHPPDLSNLLKRAAVFLPELATASPVQSWAGLRPATQDLLPMLGRIPGTERLFLAAGHYRNGILLAPGTAEVMAQILAGEATTVSLAAFSPGRFSAAAQPF